MKAAMPFLLASFVLFLQPAFAHQSNLSKPHFEIMNSEVAPLNSKHYGTAAFGTTSPANWYDISTDSYPLITPLSVNRNKGFSEGRLYLSPTGFTVGEAGDYWVEVTAVLQNPTPSSTILIPIFLGLDEEIEEGNEVAGGIATLPYQSIETIHATGILHHATEGLRLSIVATNAGYPLPTPVTVVAWSITLHKLP